MKHRLYQTILNMSEQELSAYARERKLDLPEEFCCSKPTRSKAEYICNALDLQDPEQNDDDYFRGDPGSELDKLARAIQESHPSMSYESCLGLARKQNPGLARRERESFPGGVSAGKRGARR